MAGLKLDNRNKIDGLHGVTENRNPTQTPLQTTNDHKTGTQAPKLPGDGVDGSKQQRSVRLTSGNKNQSLMLDTPANPGVRASALADKPTIDTKPASGTRSSTATDTEVGRASQAAKASATRSVSPIPPGYQVPENLEPSQPVSIGDRILNGLGIVAFAPIYILFAIFALIPALIGGAVEAPKDDNSDGSGTFMSGFAGVFRKMMGWLNGPLYKMVWKAASPARKFYVDRTTDPNNVIITVRIHLTGDANDITKVKALEKEIEERLGIDGYKINVEFVDQPSSDATTIPIDRTVWSNSSAWNPYDNDNVIDSNDVSMIAHEIMHTPLGLADEYNLQTHFTNEQMGFWQKLGVFFHRLVQPNPPDDHRTGIMYSGRNQPLARHYESILNSVG